RRMEPRRGNSSGAGLLLAAAFGRAVGIRRFDGKGNAPDLCRGEPAAHSPGRAARALRWGADRFASRHQPWDRGLRLSRATFRPVVIGHRLATVVADLVWVR